ncbi:MAG: T9SS type A sorting domain-containing protein [Ignavibacteria bacterium]
MKIIQGIDFKTVSMLSILLILIISTKLISQPVWTIQNSGTSNDLNKIFLKGYNMSYSLFVIGDNGTILRSTNSGTSWQKINSNTTADLYTIGFRESFGDTGYCAGEGGVIIKTIDGGFNWFTIPSATTSTIKDLKFTNSNVVPMSAVAVGENGTLLKLINGIWEATQIDTADLNSIAIENNTRFTIVGNSGLILRSTNSGTNWVRINSNISNNLNQISPYSSIVIGDSGVAFQIQNNNFNIINTNTVNNLYDRNYNYDIVCGASGTIFSYWQPIPSNTNTDLRSIIKSNIDNCFAVGDNGLIIYTKSFYVSSNTNQLNSNNISAWFKNNGIFNQHPLGWNGGFQWPKGENKYARYTSGHYLGALVNNEIRVTAVTYSSEYLPGYTDGSGTPHGNGTPEYKIYKLIHNVNDTDRIKWPNSALGNSDQGAPVYFDSSMMTWKPVDYGNQTMFYSYTDSYTQSHNNYNASTAPLKADIKQINFSFNQPEELKNVIYQEYRIINRSNEIWNDAYFNFYSDDDLGDSHNDAEGIDTNLRLAYTYNFTQTDGVYGNEPPAVGNLIVRAPLTYTGNSNDTVFYYEGKNRNLKIGYKEMPLNSTVIYHDDSYEPSNYTQTYNAIRGYKNDGNPHINPVTNQPTKFVYSGDPVTGNGWVQSSTSDMRFYQGFGPMTINPGDTQIIVMAQVIAKGSSNLNSITKLREAAVTAKEYYDNCFTDVVIGINNSVTSIPENFVLYQNYPNPFNPRTVINYELRITGNVKLKVYDVLGNEVAVLVNEKQNAGNYSVNFDGSNFSSGVYFYKLNAGEFSETKRMMLIK